MVLTRAERRKALDHVVTNVFMLDNADNPLSLALTKAFLVDIYDILAMPFHDIKRLAYVDDQGNEILLPSGYQYMLRIIKHYDSYRTSDGDPIGDEWTTVTADQYDDYRLSADYAGVAVTTQYARMPMSTVLKKRYKPPNPALNVHHRDAPVSTDTVNSDTPAINDGEDSVGDPKVNAQHDRELDNDGEIVMQLFADQNHIVVKAKFMDATPEMNRTMKCGKDCVPKFVADPGIKIVADPGMKMFLESLNQHSSIPMTISMDTHTETSKIASLTRFGKFGFCKIHESVSQHAPHSLNQSKLPNAVNLVDDLHIFEVNLLLDLAYVSINLRLMPPSPSISALDCGRKLESSSICEVTESDLRSIHEVLGLITNSSSDNDVGEWMDSSDHHGEFGKCQRDVIASNVDITCVMDNVPSFFKDAIIKPVSVDIKDANDLFASNNVDKLNDSSTPSEDLLSFVHSMTNVLDAATNDFYAFLKSLDSASVVLKNAGGGTPPVARTVRPSPGIDAISKCIVDPLLVSHASPIPPILVSFYGSKDFGDYSLSLDHGEDSVGDPKANYSVIAQHDRELDNDGEIVTKLFAVIAADNSAVCTLFVPHAILPPCDQEAVIVFEKDASPPPGLLCDTWFALSHGEEDILGSFSLAFVDLDYIVRDAVHMTTQEDGHQSHACRLRGGATTIQTPGFH
jgi:hypothetical protein